MSKKKVVPLMLEIFQGVGLLAKAFRAAGFGIVSGPEWINGDDIRDFVAPDGFNPEWVMGGPPCQDWSKLNRSPGNHSREMLDQYIRVVTDISPTWFLCENVTGMPDFDIPGYHQITFYLDLAWFGDGKHSRLRKFVIGCKDASLLAMLSFKRQTKVKGQLIGSAVTGNDKRSFQAICSIQGLPADFDLPWFNLAGKKKAVANGVPLQMGRYIADTIMTTIYKQGPMGDVVIDADRRICQYSKCTATLHGNAGKKYCSACRSAAYAERKKLSKA